MERIFPAVTPSVEILCLPLIWKHVLPSTTVGVRVLEPDVMANVMPFFVIDLPPSVNGGIKDYCARGSYSAD